MTGRRRTGAASDHPGRRAEADARCGSCWISWRAVHRGRRAMDRRPGRRGRNGAPLRRTGLAGSPARPPAHRRASAAPGDLRQRVPACSPQPRIPQNHLKPQPLRAETAKLVTPASGFAAFIVLRTLSHKPPRLPADRISPILTSRPAFMPYAAVEGATTGSRGLARSSAIRRAAIVIAACSGQRPVRHAGDDPRQAFDRLRFG